MSSQLLRRCVALALAASSIPVLGGCSSMLRSDQPPVQVYTLSVPRAPAARSHPRGTRAGLEPTLQVATPLAGPGLGTSQIVLRQSGHRLNFYAVSAWSTDAPALIGALAVHALRASGDWRAVQGPDSPFPTEDLLQISIRRFDADYAAGASAPTVRVRLDCTLGNAASRRVIASFAADGAAPASANRMSDVIAAFQRATDAALESMSRQAARAVR